MTENIVIIIPSLNPDEKFNNVINNMRKAGFCRFVLVDDGSDEGHKEPFTVALKGSDCNLLTHDVNLGKGQALKDAFNYVADNFADAKAVITIDGDGQHTAEDAMKIADALELYPDMLVMGCRNFNEAGVPTHNMLGNKITAGVYKLFLGLNISDAQTGLRGIPKAFLKEFAEDIPGTRFEYESNMLIYAAEKGIDIYEVPIKTLYLEENKSSHFKVVKDSIRIYKPIIAHSVSLKYVLSSLAGTAADLALFTILNAIFCERISVLILQTLLTTGLARVFSAVLNYTLNRNWVFKSSENVKSSGFKYLLTALLHFSISWLVCTYLFGLILGEGFVRTLLKLCVDFLLFLLSYFMQKKWVFKH